jgi:hypothetical protein
MRRRYYIALFLLLSAFVCFGVAVTPSSPDADMAAEEPEPRVLPVVIYHNAAGTPTKILAVQQGAAPTPAPYSASATAAPRLDPEINGAGEVDEDGAAFDAQLVGRYARALRPAYAAELAALSSLTVYSLTIEIAPDQRRALVRQRTRYANRTRIGLTTLPLRLYPNSAQMGAQMRLIDARAAERPVDAALDPNDRTILRVTLPRALAPGRSTQFDLAFEIDLPDNPGVAYAAFGVGNDILALPNAYAVVPPVSETGQFRLDALPSFGDLVASDVAVYDVRILAPASLVIVATGDCESADEGALRVTQCVAAPVRDFAIHASPSFRLIEQTVNAVGGDAVRLRVAFSADQAAAAQRALVYMADAFTMYEQQLGAYPYRVLTVFQTTTRVGGVEYPMLAGVTPQPRDEAFFEWLVAHEVAHQWWYGLVGSDPLREAWLDESLTQYTTLQYVRARSGDAAANRLRERFFSGRYAREVQERGDNRPGRPTDQFSRAAYGPMIYGKAPLFFDEVRATIGDAAFAEWIRRYAADGRYRLVGSDALLLAADATGAGPQVRESFRKWISE